MSLSSGTRLGPYEILAPIGAGGMGEVYRAKDPTLDRRVAIKVLPPLLAADPVARERLRHEAVAAAALDHPFICKIFGIGEDSGVTFIVMEFIAGQTLQERLAAGRLSIPESLRIASEMAEALAEAHARHILHRDLKPANVMLTESGHVKIMDFGLAKRFEPSVNDSTVTKLTMQGSTVGTPHYMAPEQIRGETLDPRSDLFSFGVLLCELLGGENPFRRSSTVETMAAILRDPPNMPAGLPPGPMLLIRRLLAKAPAERYQSMKEVCRDLTRVAAAPTAEEAPAEESIPLVGRETEQAELLRGLDRAMAGRGSLVLIGGEPGIGKTHLTRAVLDEARRRGALGVVGHCHEMEGAAPYIPFVEHLEYCARAAPPESFRYAVGDAAPEVAKLMPELRRMFPDIPSPLPLPPEQQRRFLFNAYRDFVGRSARVTPMVAVFEDLHWADEPTLLLLFHLAQTIAEVPALFIGTYRDLELGATRPFAGMLETLTRERLATRIALHRLPVHGVEAMLGAMSGHPPPASLARVIFEETEGNPFFVEEVFRHLSEEGKLFDQSGGWRKDLRVDRLEVPEGVRLVIGKRLERLSEEARRVLTTAAVIGRSFGLSLLEELENVHPDAALDALEEAERAHLVAAESGVREPRYQFVHELIRQTLAQELSLPRRQRLHARIGAAMEKRPGAANQQAPAIAHHLYQAGTAAAAQKTLSFLLLAADSARRSAAHEEALASLDNAVAVLGDEAGIALADVHERRADVLRSLGRLSDAVAAYEQAIAMFVAAGERVRAASACVPLQWIHAWAFDTPRAVQTLRTGFDLLGNAEEPALRAWLLSIQGALWTQSSLVEDGLRALGEAEQLCTPETRADVYVSQAYGYIQAAHFARSLQFQQKAAEVSLATGDLWLQAEIGWLPFTVRLYTGPPVKSGEVEPFLKTAVKMGHQNSITFLRWVLDSAAAYRGDLTAAEHSAEETLEFAESFGAGYRVLNHLTLASIQDYLCREDALRVSLRRAFECEPPSAFLSGISQSARFRALAIRGDSGSIEHLRHNSVAMPHVGRPNRLGAWLAMVFAVEGLAALGRVEDVAALRQSTEEFLETGAEFAWFFSTRTAAGIAAACAREWSRAEDHHRAAIHLADSAPMRILQPITRAWYAEMLAAQGDLARARVTLAEALAQYESIGMPGYALRASERLATL